MKWLKDIHNRQVRLTSERQEHIESDHPEMFGQIGRVQDTLSNPDMIIRSRTDHGVELFYRHYSTTPVTEIAARLGVGESTIRNRVRALEEGGVIKQYTVVTDPAKLGYHSVALVGIDVESSHLLDVAMQMSEFPEVKFVATSVGDHMIMTEVWLADGAALRSFIAEKVRKLDGVQRVSPTVIMDNWKVRSGYLLP